MGKGLLFVVSGPSGAGKGTICKRLLDEIDVDISISMTTRTPRNGEIDCTNYYFVSQEEFKKTKEENGFLEYAHVYGNYYGTPKKMVMEKLDQGRDVILEIDIQGALKIRESYPKGIFVFILPPSMKELRKRITGRRSETEDAINMRLGETLKEVSYIDKYDYCIINDKVDEAVERAACIMKAEHSRVSKDIYQLIERYKEEI